LRADPDREKAMADAIRKRLALGKTVEAIAASVAAVDVAVLTDLVSEVAVPETYFFRHPEHFELIATTLVPRLSGLRHIRAWSAGCATGEEAYSIAACLLASAPPGVTFEVLGTDLVPRHVERARSATYGDWSRRSRPVDLFPVVQRGTTPVLVVTDAVRRATSFLCRSILDEAPAEFDLILCRNVLLYLTDEAASTAIVHFRKALAPGGFLILGPLDVTVTLPGFARAFPAQAEVFELLANTQPLTTSGAAPGPRSRQGSGASAFTEDRSAEDEATALLQRRAERLRRPTPAAAESGDEGLEVGLFAMGQRTFALPLECLKAVVPWRTVTPVPLSAPSVLGVTRFHSEVVAVFSLAAMLGGPDAPRPESSLLLVLEAGNGSLVAIDCAEVPRPANLMRKVVDEAWGHATGAVATLHDGTTSVTLIDPLRMRWTPPWRG
jgi:chemotaxis protein methyltransferase CheR